MKNKSEASIYSNYIERLNDELSVLENIDDDAIYNDFNMFVENKLFLKKMIANGGLRYEYIQYHLMMKDTLWQDGIQKIIEIYRMAKKTEEQKTLLLLKECAQAFTDAGDKLTQRVRESDGFENWNQLRTDLAVRSMMEFIGGVIEGTIKPYIYFVSGCISIIKGKDTKQLNLGVMVQNLIDNNDVFKGIYFDMLCQEKLSNWRNVANHEKYSVIENDEVELLFINNKQGLHKKVLSPQIILFIVKQVDILAYMNKIAVELIRIDEVNSLFDEPIKKRKNSYKKKDDQIVTIVEVASKYDMKCLDIDYENKKLYFEEQKNFSKESLEKFLPKIKAILEDAKFKVFIMKEKKVHYTTRLDDGMVKILVWKI